MLIYTRMGARKNPVITPMHIRISELKQRQNKRSGDRIRAIFSKSHAWASVCPSRKINNLDLTSLTQK